MRALVNIAVLALVVALAGCRGRPPPDPLTEPVLELVPREGAPAVSRLTVTLGELRAASARLRLQRAGSMKAKPLPEALRAHVLDSLIRERVLAAEAERLVVRASTTAVAQELSALTTSYEAPELGRQLAATYQTKDDLRRRVEARLTVQALLEREAFGDLKVAAADLEEAYAALPPEQRRTPARVRAAQIVLADEVEAERVHRALTRGADFETVARSLSIAPEASAGGSLGWIVLADMPPVFASACGPLEVGKISQVTASTFGYHICKVLERAPEQALTLEQMKDRLRRERLAELRREAEEKYFATLLGRYEVVRHPARMGLENRD